MVTSQKPTAPVASPNAKSSQTAARTTPPVTAAHPTSNAGGPDSTCFVHRLEEALLLVESMQLTDEQKTKITEIAQAQSARCIEAKKQHKASHEQIIALLTSDQNQMLQDAADDSERCHKDGHLALAEHAVHA